MQCFVIWALSIFAFSSLFVGLFFCCACGAAVVREELKYELYYDSTGSRRTWM